MVPYTKIVFALLVILKTSQALPVSPPKDEKIVEDEIEIPIDEAKEFKYELNRDHELQGSINGGQSGWALAQIAHGAKPQEVISGSSSVRRKRQSGLEANSMADHLQAPSDATADEEEPAVTVEPAPIVNEAYAQRLEGSSIYKALLLAGGRRQSVQSLGGYGRKKRTTDDADEEPAVTEEPAVVVDPAVAVEPAPIVNEAYAQRLAGSAIYKALLLAGGRRQSVQSLGGYGRKKRMSEDQDEIEIILLPMTNPIDHAYAQMLALSSNPEEVLILAETIKKKPKESTRQRRQSLSFEEEAIMQQIFPVVDEINEIEQPTTLTVKPKIKSWGETGLVKNQN